MPCDKLKKTNAYAKKKKRRLQYTMQFELRSSGDPEPHSLTDTLQRLVQRKQITEGLCFIALQGSGAALLSVDCPEGDMTQAQQVIEAAQRLDQSPHLLSSLLGTSLHLPIHKGQLLRSTWQEIILVDFIDTPRLHTVTVHVLPT
jgi:thiamine phosphate synthase YjbQ (UPF0047 family)